MRTDRHDEADSH